MSKIKCAPDLDLAIREWASVGRHAWIRVLDEPRAQDGRVINMSRSGVILETVPLTIGTRVRTEVSGFEASGTVVREIAELGATNPPTVAVRFDEIQDSIGKLVSEE